MTHKRKGPAGEGRADVLLAGEHSVHTKNRTKSQHNNGIDPAELFGWPRVVIERANGRIFVKMKNRPWGWTNIDRECLSDVGAEKYAGRLNERLRIEQQREEVRKAKIREAKRRERLDRLEARNG